MARLLFLDPPSTTGSVDERQNTKLHSPNQGLLYLAAYVRERADAEVRFLDISTQGLGIPDVLEHVREFAPDFVGISAKTFNILSAYRLAEEIKRADPRVLVGLGGAHGTALPENTLEECAQVDCVVLGEGEDTVREIALGVDRAGRSAAAVFGEVAGLVWRDPAGRIARNADRALLDDLDALPLPALDLVDMSAYARLYNPVRGKFEQVFSVFGSRGCPFNCTFCMPLLSRKRRTRSIESVLDEVESLVERYGASRVYFEDSLFSASLDWFESFCRAYRERGLHRKVQWGFETRIDTAQTDMFKTAVESGCIYTFFGMESGSAHVLKKANKPYSKATILEKVSAAKQAGLNKVVVSIIFGLPYETRQSVEETLAFLGELPCDGAGVNVLDVYPGTAVWDMAESGEGGLRWLPGKRMNWDSYSRADPMVEVNDLSAQDLQEAFNRANALISAKHQAAVAEVERRKTAWREEQARIQAGRQ